MAVDTITSVDVQTLTPFKKFIMTLGILPTSYLESMTYAEMIMWFCNFLQNDVIPTVNNNANALQDLITYINNLNFQDEVDHKLDEMAESGELQEIVADYLNTKAVFGFDTVADMKDAENLIDGSYAKTLGFNELNDGGSSLYKVRTVTNEDVVDEKTIIALATDTLVAELVLGDSISPEQVGAKGDGTTDDTDAIQTAVNVANSKKVKITLSAKTYIITEPITLYSYIEIDGNKATIKTTEGIKMFVSSGCSHLNIHDLVLIGDDSNDCYGFYLTCYFSDFNNITIGNVYTGFYIDTVPAAGTLVENRFNYMKVYHYKYAGLYFGITDNNKATDGFLNNAILSGDEGASYGIFIGSSAGWNINNVHVYGQNNRAIQLDNSNATNVSNIYIEYFVQYGIVMSKTQTGNNITNVYIRHRTNGTTGDAIHVEVSGVLPGQTHGGNLTNINILRGAVTTGKSINIAGGATHSWNASNIIIDSTAGRTIANDCTNIKYNDLGIHYSNEYKLSNNNVSTTLSYLNGYNLAGFNQNTTAIDIILPTLANSVPTAIKLIAVGGQYTSQSGKFYEGLIYVVKDNSGNLHAWIKNSDLNEVFSTAPTVSVDNENNKLVLSVGVNSLLYGRLYYMIYS